MLNGTGWIKTFTNGDRTHIGLMTNVPSPVILGDTMRKPLGPDIPQARKASPDLTTARVEPLTTIDADG